jgi:DNA-binding MarR family transcriptional regulator
MGHGSATMNNPAVSLLPADPADAGHALQLDQFLPYRLSLCANVVSTALSKIYAERYNIGMPEWRVIVILGESGSMTAKAIGARSYMHKTKVSRAVALLERRKFVSRRANVADLREAFLSLTPDGRTVYDELAPRAVEFADRLIASIDPADRAPFCRAIKQLMEQSGPIADDIANRSNPG